MDRFCSRKAAIAQCLLAVLFAWFGTARASDINIITWWGYIDNDAIAALEKSCQTRVHVDEYYSNPEFLRRASKGRYDIAIYSDTVYNTFIARDHVARADIARTAVNSYDPKIRNVFLSAKYPADTVYFQLSLTGFLWNPKNISITPTDSIETIFEKARGKTIVVLDEHVEVMNLLSKTAFARDVTTPGNAVGMDPIKGLVANSKLIVTSSLGTTAQIDDFAFAFTWSGEALEKISAANDGLHFMVHPKLSHWSKDLLTVLSDSKPAACVGKVLAGDTYIRQLTATSYYFSPYKQYEQQKSTRYRNMAQQFFEQFERIQPLPTVSAEEYSRLDAAWQEFKLRYAKSGD